MQQFSIELQQLLELNSAPIGIRFTDTPIYPRFNAPMSDLTEDGRSGTVAASCVFWVQNGSFSTAAADHGNCSVGKYVHGFAEASDIIKKSDVSALLDVGWVTETAFASVVKTSKKAAFIEYAPAADMPEPDILLIRLNAKQMMQLGDAVDDLSVSGKPQCQIIPLARESGLVTVSFGCALSRERTGMSETELTCAIPANQVATIVADLRQVTGADTAVRGYAQADATRF